MLFNTMTEKILAMDEAIQNFGRQKLSPGKTDAYWYLCSTLIERKSRPSQLQGVQGRNRQARDLSARGGDGMKNKTSWLTRALLGILIATAVVFVRADVWAQDVSDAPQEGVEGSESGEERETRSRDIYGPSKDTDTAISVPEELSEQDQSGITASDEPGEVSVRKLKENQWEIINRYNEAVGLLKSDSKAVFQLYDLSGARMGRILENGAWFPRNYAGRDTKIISREVYLYLDALDAIELIKSGE